MALRWVRASAGTNQLRLGDLGYHTLNFVKQEPNARMMVSTYGTVRCLNHYRRAEERRIPRRKQNERPIEKPVDSARPSSRQPTYCRWCV
ncbi:hypothetical protein MLPM_0121 [Mycobacterium lepromatosis]|uniref:Uncharacterized protein n=1 Tax=Mycobacterium lepromatosis TaxID=480418 RepID=A0A0F4EW61_9MYCO|nr:hypothetical protein MLPM_0121 [Mycobacterium lepromatosis]